MSKYAIRDKVLIEGVIKRIDENANYPYQVLIADVHKIYFSEDEIKDASKTYEDGLADAWELARKIDDMSISKMQEIFDISKDVIEVQWELFNSLTPQQALAKIEAYEESKAIKVGDVVYANDGTKSVVIDYSQEEGYMWVFNENGCVEETKIKHLKKTGRHIDIEHLLEQIRGNE